jgi:signal peptidase II
VTISLGVIAVIVLASRRLPADIVAVGLGLVLGGAIGNLIDRGTRGPGFSGEVVDFIDLQVWPVFNLADSAIVIGAALLLLSSLRRDRRGGIREGSSPGVTSATEETSEGTPRDERA